MNSLLPTWRRCWVKREKPPSTHIFIGVKSLERGHHRDHESWEQGGISLKNFGLHHVTKIIATVTTRAAILVYQKCKQNQSAVGERDGFVHDCGLC